MLAAVAALAFGFARPTATKKVARQRGTIILAIDTSGSMAATDVTPSRLVAAQTAARNFIAGLPKGLKIGLISFDSGARVLVAPTTDHAPVLAAVNALTIGGGTATGVAIQTALDSAAGLAPGANGQKAPAAIVLMSDGSPTIGRNDQPSDAQQSVADAVAAAKTAKVPIDTIAFGTASGTVTIQGETVPVPADPHAMATIAAGERRQVVHRHDRQRAQRGLRPDPAHGRFRHRPYRYHRVVHGAGTPPGGAHRRRGAGVDAANSLTLAPSLRRAQRLTSAASALTLAPSLRRAQRLTLEIRA